MKLKISIIFCAFLWFESAKCSLSCVGTFLREKNIKHLTLVDQRSDLPLKTLFDSTDWSVIVSQHGTLLEDSHPESDVIIITTSMATFRNSTINLKMGRVCMILNDERPSIDGIFLKFKANMRNNVIVIAKIAMNRWHFHRFNEFGCSENSAKSVEVFAECDESDSSENLTYFSNHTKLNGKKCPLTVAATKYEPFTYYDESKGFYKGIDYFLVKAIAQQLQIDVNFIRADVNSMALVCVFQALKMGEINSNENENRIDFAVKQIW